MIFISDDVSKTTRDERSKLRKNYLQEIKARSGVLFALYRGAFQLEFCIRRMEQKT